MYNASNKFQAYTAASIVRRPKSKIEVGGVTYTGETALISYPKISHTAEKMIGGFPAKTCSFEIYNRNGELSLNAQEITVYRGLEIDGSVEWVPMGIFAADDENITNNLTKRSISFKGTDRSRLFDTQFVNDITYPCTVAQFVSHLCRRHGITLETTTFPFSDRVLLTAPNADSSVSERELISRIAELGGCIAQISRTGGLRISAPQATGKTVKKRYYKTVSKEPKFGAITAVSLGHAEYSDDIIYPENANENSVNWRIEDNPFVDGAIAKADGITATTRETLIADIAANIIGRNIVPFGVADFVDDYIYDLNDAITVEEKDGGTFETVILNLSTASRIKSNIGSDVQISGSTKYNLAGSVKQSLKKVLLEVDHQNNKISALAQDFSNLDKEVSASLEVMAGKIQGVVTRDDLSTTVTQLNNSWEIKFNDLENPDSLENAATKITAEGVEIYNGKIQIFDSNNNVIFGTDSSGNLSLVGTIKTSSNNSYYAELAYGGLYFYDGTTLVNKLGIEKFIDRENNIETLITTTEKGLNIKSGQILTNSSFGSDSFTGLKHFRTVVGGNFSVGVGIGKANNETSATGSIEVRDEYYSGAPIYSRLDFTKSTVDDCVIDIRGSYGEQKYSKWLSLGEKYLRWNGDIAPSGNVELGNGKAIYGYTSDGIAEILIQKSSGNNVVVGNKSQSGETNIYTALGKFINFRNGMETYPKVSMFTDNFGANYGSASNVGLGFYLSSNNYWSIFLEDTSLKFMYKINGVAVEITSDGDLKVGNISLKALADKINT